MDIPDLKNSTRFTRSEVYLKNHYPDFYEYIMNRYPIPDYFPEKLYWYAHKLEGRPICPVCGKELKFITFIDGYKKFCSTVCNNQSYETKERKRQSCLRKYGVENPAQLQSTIDKMKKTCLEKYGVENAHQSDIIKDKIKQTCLEKYGVENPRQNKDIKIRAKQTCLEKYGVENPSQAQTIKDKKIETSLKHYGVPSPNMIKEIKDKIKQTCLERYGTDNYSKTSQFLEKAYNTKKKNHSFNTSKLEEEFSSYLDSNSINYIRQHKNEKYPFSCDFYFPERDIYLEINGTWTHGQHPFDPESIEDNIKLDIWKSKDSNYYRGAIETWTITDPHKVQVARENGIQLYVFYGHMLENLINFCKEKNIL